MKSIIRLIFRCNITLFLIFYRLHYNFVGFEPSTITSDLTKNHIFLEYRTRARAALQYQWMITFESD